MVTKQKHFLDSLRQMVSKAEDNTCPTCQKVYEGEFCLNCNTARPSAEEQNEEQSNNLSTATAYLVDLVSNNKITIPIPACKIGRDESNDIVVSGDQSISRHHASITHNNNQYFVEDITSRHGTFLNGTQVKNSEPINDGDVLKIGVSLFWFVIETGAGNRDTADISSRSAVEKSGGPEQAHVTVKPDILNQPSDSSTSTMNEIPVMANEHSLMERMRLKTHSFDQSGLFAHAKSQPGKIGPTVYGDSSKPSSETQTVLPALAEYGGYQDRSPDSLSLPVAPAVESSQQSMQPLENMQPYPESDGGHLEQNQGVSSLSNMLPGQPAGDSTAYDRLMKADLAELTGTYDQLKHKIEETQKQMKQIANELNALRALGTNLIGGSGIELVEACNKVFSQLGWQTSPNEQDFQELHLRNNDQLCIARIIWTAEEPERSHLGQLSISQTQHWCNQGHEPKGILIVSRLSNKDNHIPSLTHADYESELTNYAAKKNVCMMTSAQILAIYRDLIIKHADINTLREKITSTNGWLEGFAIKSPGTK